MATEVRALPGGIAELARIIGRSERVTYRMALEGDLPVIRLSNGRYLVPMPLLERWLNGELVTPAQKAALAREDARRAGEKTEKVRRRR